MLTRGEMSAIGTPPQTADQEFFSATTSAYHYLGPETAVKDHHLWGP